MSHLQVSAVLPARVLTVYDLLTNPNRLPELVSDSLEVELVSVPSEIKRLSEVCYQMTRYSLTQRVRFCITDFSKGNFFSYRQTEGLFRKWVHLQSFKEHGEDSTLVTDIIDYEVPLGVVGHLLNDLLIREDLKKILSRRLKKATDILEKAKDN